MFPSDRSPELIVRDLGVIKLKDISTEKQGLQLASWITEVDRLEADNNISGALVVTTELINSNAHQLSHHKNFVRLIMKAIRLSGAANRRDLQSRYVSMLKETWPADRDKTNATDAILTAELVETAIFALDNQILDLIDEVQGSIAHNQQGRIGLTPENLERIREVWNSASCTDPIISATDAMLELIAKETIESQRILLKSCLYSYIAMNPLPEHQETIALLSSVSEHICHMDRWSGVLRKKNNNEFLLAKRAQSGLLTENSTSHSIDAIVDMTSSQILFIALNHSVNQVNRCVELTRRLILCPAMARVLPEIYDFVSFEIQTLTLLGLAKNHAADDVIITSALPGSLVSELRTTFNHITIGDFDAAKISLEIYKTRSRELSKDSSLSKQLVLAAELCLQTFAAFLGDPSAEIYDILCTDAQRSSSNATLTEHLLASGVEELNVIRVLNEAKNSNDSSVHESAHEIVVESLRKIHKHYGSRNFLFTTLSIAALDFEFSIFPKRASKRLVSLSNLFDLINFSNREIKIQILSRQIEIEYKLGDNTKVIEAATSLEHLSLDTNDFGRFSWALLHHLNSFANTGLVSQQRSNLVERAFVWIEDHGGQIAPEFEFDIKLSLVRNLTQDEDILRANTLLHELASSLNETTSYTHRRLLWLYSATIANQLNNSAQEATAWKMLDDLKRDDLPFYSLQSSRTSGILADDKNPLES